MKYFALIEKDIAFIRLNFLRQSPRVERKTGCKSRLVNDCRNALALLSLKPCPSSLYVLDFGCQTKVTILKSYFNPIGGRVVQ